jgi:1,4-alpha-glucan branching enzyme
MLAADVARSIAAGNHTDLFSVLGCHKVGDKQVVRAFVPEAEQIEIIIAQPPENGAEQVISLLENPEAEGLFEGEIRDVPAGFYYRLLVSRGQKVWETEDPYRFGSVLGDLDEHLIGEGSHLNIWNVLGAQVITHEGIAGTHFAVWAPAARRVSVVGDFNQWDGRRHGMQARGETGIWEIFIPNIGEGVVYKFELQDKDGKLLPLKSDPFGFASECPPKNASVVKQLHGHEWQDNCWMNKRDSQFKINQPISIYEVHLGSWRRIVEDNNRSLSYLEHAEQLVSYVKALGFTHIELMPISEFPFDGSWGYQPIGLYAPTARYGTLEEFRGLIEACHAAGVGVILDWVAGHFPRDENGLGSFDGTSLFEHADVREGVHFDWNTLVYNYGRHEVSNYLIANALYWLKEHHIDGLRVDAVASMLYKDYSREENEWLPNKNGGRENLEAITFLQRMNEICYGEMPGIMTFAEESSAFPGVSSPTDYGGLGFGFKWNMGWMNDTLAYIQHNPEHRKYHHHQMTFGFHYAFSENYVLPISHDEVVYGKGSMLAKMPGNQCQKFANLRAYYGFMWGHPGKKLLFMGCEFAQQNEWNHDVSLDWHLLEDRQHKGVQNLIRDLNQLYRTTAALHELDCNADGFEWVEGNAVDESLVAWIRKGREGSAPILVVANFTPCKRVSRRIGVPNKGKWIERLNTDSEIYGGCNMGNLGAVQSDSIAASGYAQSLCLTIPPLSTVFFELTK